MPSPSGVNFLVIGLGMAVRNVELARLDLAPGAAAGRYFAGGIDGDCLLLIVAIAITPT